MQDPRSRHPQKWSRPATALVALLVSLAVLTGCSINADTPNNSEVQRNAGAVATIPGIGQLAGPAISLFGYVNKCSKNLQADRPCLEGEMGKLNAILGELAIIRSTLSEIQSTMAANQAQTIASFQTLRLDQTTTALQAKTNQLGRIEAMMGQAMEANNQVMNCYIAAAQNQPTCDVGVPDQGGGALLAVEPTPIAVALQEATDNLVTIVGFMDRERPIAEIVSVYSGLKSSGYNDGIAALAWKAYNVKQGIALARDVDANVTSPLVVTPQLQAEQTSLLAYYTSLLGQYGYLRTFVASAQDKNAAAVNKAVATYIDGSIAPANPGLEGTRPIPETNAIYSLPTLEANQLLVSKPNSDQVFRTTNQGDLGSGNQVIPDTAPTGTQVLNLSETFTTWLGKDSYNMIRKAGQTPATAQTPAVDVLPELTSSEQFWAVNQPVKEVVLYSEGSSIPGPGSIKISKPYFGWNAYPARVVTAPGETPSATCKTGVRFINPNVPTERRQTDQGVLLFANQMPKGTGGKRQYHADYIYAPVAQQATYDGKVVVDFKKTYTDLIKGNADFDWVSFKTNEPVQQGIDVWIWGYSLSCYGTESYETPGQVIAGTNYKLVTFEELAKPKSMG